MRLIAVAALAIFALVGCENEGANQQPSPRTVDVDSSDPCALLSPTEIQRAIKGEVSSEKEVKSRDGATPICLYPAAKPWSSVSLSVGQERGQDVFNDHMERDPLNTEPVEGIGDGAFIHACAGITVLIGDVIVSAGVQHLTTCEETGEILRALGQEVEKALH